MELAIKVSCTAGFPDSKEEASKVAAKSNIWPHTWVAMSTCWRKLWESSIEIKCIVSGEFEVSKCKFMSQLIKYPVLKAVDD